MTQGDKFPGRDGEQFAGLGSGKAYFLLTGLLVCMMASAATTEHAASFPENSGYLPAMVQLDVTRSSARSAEADYHVDVGGRASNPRQGLDLEFTAHGLAVRGEGGGFALHLARFGRGAGEPVRPMAPHIEGAWVEYARAEGVSEWFVNLPEGVEQGWTVLERPDGTGPLALELNTGRAPDATAEGRMSWSGMDYHGLVAVDARGRELPARWVHDGARLRIEVDDGDAEYPVLIDPWIRAAQLTFGLDNGTNFGRAVAISGDSLVVGANFIASRRGSAFVFTRSGANWNPLTELIPNDGQANDRFGFAVAVAEDTIVIGSPQPFTDGEAGAAYVFTRENGEWNQQAKLVADDGAAGDQFGTGVAVQGDHVLVGATHVEVDGNVEQGAVYHFQRDGEVWTQQDKLVPAAGDENDRFGSNIDISDDTALIGAGSVNQDGVLAEAAWVYTLDGDSWSEQAMLTASDGVQGDHFGNSGALDGDTALVGAPMATTDGSTSQGAGYIFTRSGGVWSEDARLVAAAGGGGDAAAGAVGLSGDTAVLGAPLALNIVGTAYVFTFSEGTWTETLNLNTEDEDPFFLLYGSSVAVEDDVIVIGQPGENALFSTLGVVYTYHDVPSDFATIEGTVHSQGGCHDGPTPPLANATVEITDVSGTRVVETSADGLYRSFVSAGGSPVDITVSATDHVPATAEGVSFGAGDTVVEDFELVLEAPCADTEPSALSTEVGFGLAEPEPLTIENIDGVAALEWTLSFIDSPASAAQTAPAGSGGATRLSATDQPLSEFVALPEAPVAFGSMAGNARGGVVDCIGEPDLIIHDDGSPENGYGATPDLVGEVRWVDRFTPSNYPASMDAICLGFVGGEPTLLDFDIVVFDDDGPGGSPGTELGSLAATAEDIPGLPVPDEATWYSYDISSLGISLSAGSVYIGVRYAPPEPNVFVLADQSDGNPAGFAGGYWWNDNTGEWQPIQEAGGPLANYRALFIRVLENVAECESLDGIPWLDADPAAGTTPAGETTNVQLLFDADGLDPGDYETALCMETNDPGRSRILVPVSMTVLEPVPGVGTSPGSIDFGPVNVGTPSAPETVTIESTGTGELQVDSISAPGTGFSATGGTCAEPPFALQPGESCTLEYVFNPPSAGDFSTIVTVESNAGPAGIALNGTGVEPGIAVAPTAVDFGEVPVGEASAVEAVTIESTGDGVLEIGAVGSPDEPFSLTGGSCGPASFALQPGESCNLEFTFVPTAAGDFDAESAIESNASDVTVMLVGEGVEPEVSLSPELLDFRPIELGAEELSLVTLANTGTLELEVSAITGPGEPFSLAQGTCPAPPFTLAPEADCDIGVLFAPTVEGSFSASFEILSNAPSSPDSVTLQGQGLALVIPTFNRIGAGFLVLLLALVGWMAVGRRQLS